MMRKQLLRSSLLLLTAVATLSCSDATPTGPVAPSQAQDGLLSGLVGGLLQPVVKVVGFVNATPEFADQPKVINGCSDLFVDVFGERGRHARSAIGVASLPNGIPVEIEAIVEFEDA